jgi:hypothetical protein
LLDLAIAPSISKNGASGKAGAVHSFVRSTRGLAVEREAFGERFPEG